MTQNQLMYQANLEKERANKMSETQRAQELIESRRANLAKEREANRSNKAKEMETRRSNMRNEAILSDRYTHQNKTDTINATSSMIKGTGSAIGEVVKSVLGIGNFIRGGK